jgi:hypothetical protein
MTTLCFLRFVREVELDLAGRLASRKAKSLMPRAASVGAMAGDEVPDEAELFSRWWRRLAMRRPSALDWIQPPYVSGGS